MPFRKLLRQIGRHAEAGGDGTARDIYNAMGRDRGLTLLGIPAGVKMYSGVFALNPRSAGDAAVSFLETSTRNVVEAERHGNRKARAGDARLLRNDGGEIPIQWGPDVAGGRR